MVERLVYKAMIAGDPGVGKTSLLRAFITGTPAEPARPNRNEADTKHIKDFCRQPNVTLNAWNLGSKDLRQDTRFAYYNGCVGGLFVFDLERPESARSLKKVWCPEFEQFAPKYFEGTTGPKAMLGNKADRPDRCVEFNAACSFARDLDLDYLETSAKTGANVDACFKILLGKALYKARVPRVTSAYVNGMMKQEARYSCQVFLVPAPRYEKLTPSELSDQVRFMDATAYPQAFPDADKPQTRLADDISRIKPDEFEYLKTLLLPSEEAYARVIEAVPSYKAFSDDAKNRVFCYKK